MRVKICGITRIEDAVRAITLGATEIGFIFAESPRKVTIKTMKSLLRDLPNGSHTIGVFKDERSSTILDIAEKLPLKGVQLHGSEAPELVAMIRRQRPDLFLIKTISEVQGKFNLGADLYSHCDALIFDCGVSHFKADERIPLQSVLPMKSKKHIIHFLAGSLGPDNILSMIEKHRPDGIDLSSGVESSPGIKDEKLMNRLFSTLRGIV